MTLADLQVKLQSQPKVVKGELPLYTGAFDATRKAGASIYLLEEIWIRECIKHTECKVLCI